MQNKQNNQLKERRFKAIGGSRNEMDEIALLLSKTRDPFKMCLGMYGSEAHAIFANPERKNRFLRSVGFTPEHEEKIEELEAKVKEEREHNAAFEAETKRQYEEQQAKNKIKNEESGYQTI